MTERKTRQKGGQTSPPGAWASAVRAHAGAWGRWPLCCRRPFLSAVRARMGALWWARTFARRGKPGTWHRKANPAKRVRRELAVLAGLLLALLLSNFTQFASACAAVRADTLRLHILAASDSEADQALKLAVRDAILAEAGGLFAAGGTKQEALDAARRSLPLLQSIAQETLRAHGCADAVSVRLEELYFDTREYDGFTLPAGRYDAVRVELGAHAGKNWFCVLFPPLCLPAASDTQDVPEGDVPAYSDAEQNVISGPYRIRFATVELLEGWKEALRQAREDAAQ